MTQPNIITDQELGKLVRTYLTHKSGRSTIDSYRALGGQDFEYHGALTENRIGRAIRRGLEGAGLAVQAIPLVEPAGSTPEPARVALGIALAILEGGHQPSLLVQGALEAVLDGTATVTDMDCLRAEQERLGVGEKVEIDKTVSRLHDGGVKRPKFHVVGEEPDFLEQLGFNEGERADITARAQARVDGLKAIDELPWNYPVADMTDEQLRYAHMKLCAKIDEFEAAPDEDKAHGGSPGEWMYERIMEYDTAAKKRGITFDKHD